MKTNVSPFISNKPFNLGFLFFAISALSSFTFSSRLWLNCLDAQETKRQSEKIAGIKKNHKKIFSTTTRSTMKQWKHNFSPNYCCSSKWCSCSSGLMEKVSVSWDNKAKHFLHKGFETISGTLTFNYTISLVLLVSCFNTMEKPLSNVYLIFTNSLLKY